MWLLEKKANRWFEMTADDPDHQQEQMQDILRTLIEADLTHGMGKVPREPPSEFCRAVFATGTSFAQEVARQAGCYPQRLKSALVSPTPVEMIHSLIPHVSMD
jgi:hypothetical protein